MTFEKFFENTLKTLIIVPMWIALVFYRGLMFSLMWGWFLVPIGVRSITTSQAIGISFVVGSLFLSLYTFLVEIRKAVLREENADKSKFEQEFTDSVLQFLLISFTMLIGWIWHFFIA